MIQMKLKRTHTDTIAEETLRDDCDLQRKKTDIKGYFRKINKSKT